MTHFSIHDPDGRIVQANKVYDPTGYADRLNELGQNFVASDHASPISLDLHFVDKGALRERPTMAVQVSKTEIKAGGSDVSVFSGILAGSRVTVSTGGMQVGSEIISGRSFELPIPVPCIYHVRIEKFPARPFECDVRGLA